MMATRHGLPQAKWWLVFGVLCLSVTLAGSPSAAAQEAGQMDAALARASVPCVFYSCEPDPLAAWEYRPPLAGGGRFGALAASLDPLVAQSRGTWGIAIADLGSTEMLLRHGDTRFTSGSLYKLGVLAEARNQLDTGQLSWNERITLSATDVDDQYGGSAFSAGASLSLADALDWMITRSDNGVALAVLRRLGLRAINAQFQALGMTGTGVDWDTWTTPRDQLVLFRSLARGEVVSGPASRSMLGLLARQQINDRIPGGLPADEPWRVAHKTGNWETAINDAGVVDTPAGAFVLCILVERMDNYQAAIDTFHAIADLTYATFMAGDGATPRPTMTLCLAAWPEVCAPERAAPSP